MSDKNYAPVCGIYCGSCDFLGEQCEGCGYVAGKPFWTTQVPSGVCPLHDCCRNQKQLEHCGLCEDFPCKTFLELRDPSMSDEEFQKSLETRQEALQRRTNMGTQYLKPIHHKIRINAPSERVWEIISSPGNLEYCHPFCESNPVDKWPGKGSIDYVYYYNGLKYIRQFTDWNNSIGYELVIGKTNGRKSKVIWRIDKIDNTSSYLNITIYPHDIKRYPSFARPIVYYLFIKPSLNKYLSSVLNGFQWYITTNERVRKNQFGTHKWFSG